MPTYQMTDDQTLQSVIASVCSLLSLPAPADPAGSTDPNIQLMQHGREPRQPGDAEHLRVAQPHQDGRDHCLHGQRRLLLGRPTETAFDLPGDFLPLHRPDAVERRDALPCGRPRVAPGLDDLHGLPDQRQLHADVADARGQDLLPERASVHPGKQFRFMYLSRALVRDADNPDLYKNVATKNGDKFLLDGLLMTLMTRVKWLEAKGFDSGAAVRDFMLAFDSRVGAQKGANILNMAGGPHDYPYIGIGNLPEASLYGMRQ